MKTILLVDDDMDFRLQARIGLEAAGYEVVEAAGLEEAMGLIEQGPPDAAVVDLMMETTDGGMILAHHIKRRHPGVPVLMVTAVTRATGLSFEEDLGSPWLKVDAILPKPVRPEQLVGELERLLHLGRGEVGE